MADDGKGLPFDRLHGQENWAIWSDAMQTYLEAINCWKIVNGDEKRPILPELTSEATGDQIREYERIAEKQERWDQRNARAKHEINRMISPTLLYLVADSTLKTPGERWKKLCEQFQRDTMTNQLQIITQLIELKMNANETIDSYYRRYFEISQRLTALKCDISKEVRIAVLIRGLSNIYDTIRAAYLAKGNFEISELFESLRSEEVRISQRDGESTQVMKMSSQVHIDKNNGGFRRVQQDKFQPKTRGPPGSCYECGKMGHKAKNCWKKNSGRRLTCKSINVERSSNAIDAEDHSRMMSLIHTEKVMTIGHNNKTKPQKISERTMEFYIDSGASSHMVYDRNCFDEYHELPKRMPVRLGNGDIVYAIGKGTVGMSTVFHSVQQTFSLQNVYHVPDLTDNFISVSAMTRVGKLIAVFNKSGVEIKDNETKETLAYGKLVGGIYLLTCKMRASLNMVCTKDESAENNLKLWHRRLGHCSVDRLKSALGQSEMEKLENVDMDDYCMGCIKGKSVKAPFPKQEEISSKNVLDLIHTDVCGPFSCKSAGGADYFVTFIDDYSRMRALFPLARKSDLLDALREFEAMVTTQTGRKIKAIRSDNGGEYMNHRVQNWMKQKGIRHEVAAPYSPQQNGVAERTNRILCESAVAMMEEAEVDRSYWAEAVSTACYISNRLPTRATKMTPYERWYGEKPDLKHLKVWGCIGFALKTGPEKRKMESRVRELRFIGYDLYNRSAYRMLDEEQKRVYIRRDVKFLEHTFRTKGKEQTKAHTVAFPDLSNQEEFEVLKDDDIEIKTKGNEMNDGNEQIIPVENVQLIPTENDLSDSDGNENSSIHDAEIMSENKEMNVKDEQVTRRLRTEIRPPQRYGEWAKQDDVERLDWMDISRCQVLCKMVTDSEPKAIEEAMNGPEANEWTMAVQDELDSLNEMNTWTLVPLPKNVRNVVDCKWIFRKKYNEDGQIDRYKARLVARGFSQEYGVDYLETFAPVVRLNTLRAVIAVAVQKNFEIHQMDVKTAFLNGELEETVYMKQPPGITEKGKEDWVCKLNKSLYGLKQSPRQWNCKFDASLKEMGFKQSIKDPCLYVKNNPSTYVTVYVDDVVIAGENTESVEKVKDQLKKAFKMKDMGRLHHVLGIKVVHEKNGGINLSQESYIRSLLKRFDLQNMKIYSTPSDTSVILKKHCDDENTKLVDLKLYQSMVGSLMYCSLGSRPDIQYAVSVAARYCSKPNQHHMTAVKRIFGYLKGTIRMTLSYKPENVALHGYSDADFARDIDDRKSTSGYVFKLSNGAISWYSGKQKAVSVSTANAEYIALGAATREGLFLKQLYNEMGVTFEPIEIFEDNQAAMAIAKNPVYHSKQKHIDVQYHFLRDVVHTGEVKLSYCPTNEMVADLLTKPLQRNQFKIFRKELGLCETGLEEEC